MSGPEPVFLALDLGGTRFRVAAFAGDRLLDRSTDDSDPERGVDTVLDDIAAQFRAITSRHGRAVALGVAAPGPLDPWTNVLYAPPNMPGWSEVHIGDELSRRLGVPVLAGNDANLAALGEARFGAGRGFHSLAYLTVSTGIGGGIIEDRRLVLGGHGFAGEFGHQLILPDGPECPCGLRGHLEALASGTAIGRIARERLAAGAESTMLALAGGEISDVSAEHVMAAARAGDAVARVIVQETIRYLAIGISNVIVAVDPQVVILGGGVMQSADLLLAPLREQAAALVMPGLRGRARIETVELGDDAGLWGAYVLARQAAGTEDDYR